MTDKLEDVKKGSIVLISNEYPNGNKTREVGFVTSIKETEKGLYVTLNPVERDKAKEIRDIYCTEEYNHQGHKNCYSDTYGFACTTLKEGNFIILGEQTIKKAPALWSPAPGNTAFDLMC